MKYNACLQEKRSEREKEEAEKLEIQHWILVMGISSTEETVKMAGGCVFFSVMSYMRGGNACQLMCCCQKERVVSALKHS